MHTALLRAIFRSLACMGVSAIPSWAQTLQTLAAPTAERPAPSEKSWPFCTLRKVEPPADATGWSANGIDRFVRAKQQEHGLQPAPPADRRALLRRVTFDLIGLPPTPEEVD